MEASKYFGRDKQTKQAADELSSRRFIISQTLFNYSLSVAVSSHGSGIYGIQAHHLDEFGAFAANSRASHK